MKTSFYFFLWIIIYPLLGLIHSQWIYQNSFIVALFIIFGLSWILNKNMPETINYERISERVIIFEEVFSGNINSFMKRLSRMVKVEFITALYLGIAFIFVLFSMVRGSAEDWISLIIFGFFAFGAISRSIKLNQAYHNIKQNPTLEECSLVLEDTLRMDFKSYYNIRRNNSLQALLPPEPKYFKVFQIFSLIFAVICAVLGFIYLILSIIMLTTNNRGPEAISGGIMYFLYGSLAIYFGIKDTYSCISYFKRKRISLNK